MPVKGLNDNAIATSVAELNARLADMIALRLALKQAHWNVKGPNFIAIHELFDAVHGRLAGHEDILAERVQILGGVALGTLEAVGGAATVEAYPTDLVADRDHVAAISARMAALGETVRGAIETVSDAGDEGTMDIFVALSRALDKDLWFIESNLGG
ncbi:DNA starvation/stationary phase protection protein Dps [Albidovulum sp.]|jgi:starvation-inducible DNA-binding protein|uniref:DNA starvation/stationary phase protection protein Dps n=1 Tax=Albidovulum sp. TaxID=1872424 RepID=UPI0030263BB0